MKDYKEFYVVKDGATMMTVHPDIDEEERAFRSEMRAGLRAINQRLGGLESRMDRIEAEQELTRKSIYRCFDMFYFGIAIISVVLAVWGFARAVI